MGEIIAAFIFGWLAAPALDAFVAALVAIIERARKSYKAAKQREGE